MMEFGEKLRELRKQKGLTQEELASELFVSRAAISKWESGRGYPGIDSLKAIAGFFGMTIDDLLSGDELLTLAQEDVQQKESRCRDLTFGLLDCSIAMLFFLPFFGQKANTGIQAVSLMHLEGISPYVRLVYCLVVTGIAVSGVLTLALQSCRNTLWVKSKSRISIALNAAGALLFIISLQPYAAVFLFIILTIKGLMLIRWP